MEKLAVGLYRPANHTASPLVFWEKIIIIMKIGKAPTLRLKALSKHTHIMYIEMDFFKFLVFVLFLSMCLTKSGERGKTVKVLQLRKIRGSGTCECVVTRASSFVFYSFRNCTVQQLL